MGPAGTRLQVKAGRGEECYEEWWRKDGTQKGEPTGVDRDDKMPRAAKEGKPYEGRGRRNGLAAQGCRNQQGTGEQVEGVKIASVDTGGVGQREWTLVQVDKRSKNEIGGRIRCKER